VLTGGWLVTSLATKSQPRAKWAGTAIRNGELLQLAAKEFDAFVTTDRNLTFQQNLSLLSIAVIVLHTKRNRLDDLRLLMPDLLGVLESLRPRAIYDIGEDHSHFRSN
jgi:hypothetical protein